MASHASQVIDALLLALRALHAHYDLSTSGGTPRVDLADAGLPTIAPPYVLLSLRSARPTYGQQQTQYSLALELEWWGWAPTTDLTTLGRTKAALDLASDVVSAVQRAQTVPTPDTLLRYATTLLASVDDVFGDGVQDPPGAGLVHGTIEYVADFVDAGV